MTDPHLHETIQRLEHRKRLLELQLHQGEDIVKVQILRNGELRAKLARVENERHRVLGRPVIQD